MKSLSILAMILVYTSAGKSTLVASKFLYTNQLELTGIVSLPVDQTTETGSLFARHSEKTYSD